MTGQSLELKMKNMFKGAKKFNGDISGWSVDNVINIGMFEGAKIFNIDIARWMVIVLNMKNMFKDTENFNRDISYIDNGFSWDVANVTNMEGMLW